MRVESTTWACLRTQAGAGRGSRARLLSYCRCRGCADRANGGPAGHVWVRREPTDHGVVGAGSHRGGTAATATACRVHHRGQLLASQRGPEAAARSARVRLYEIRHDGSVGCAAVVSLKSTSSVVGHRHCVVIPRCLEQPPLVPPPPLHTHTSHIHMYSPTALTPHCKVLTCRWSASEHWRW